VDSGNAHGRNEVVLVVIPTASGRASAARPPSSTRRVALVTGASRGLGAVIACRLAADGWTVALNYRSGTDAARRVVEDITEAGGVAQAFAADVTDERAVADLVDRVRDQLGPIEVLVANATGPQPQVPVEDLTWQAHLDQLLFFVKSPTLLLRAVLPDMKARQHGRVIQIGSDMFERALPGMSAYVAAKGAQVGLTRSWARELWPAGITVNLVAPGWIPVERHADASREDLDEYRAEVPVRRLGVPDDVAAIVAFLATDDAALLTGQRIAVNGGHTLD
jgi:3-oxoacyl-[acyl-carrier protein] reductase